MSDNSANRPVVAAVADLIFGARVRAAATAAGVPLVIARDAAAVLAAAPGARMLLLDLDARWLDGPAVIRRLKQGAETAGVPIVAFVSHVRVDAIGAAREAGADRVLARSAFVKELPMLLGGGQ